MTLPPAPLAFLAASALAGVAGLVALLRPSPPRLDTVAALALRAAAALGALAFVLRWREAGHLPMFGTWEGSLSLALAVVLAAVFLESKWRSPGRLSAAGLVAVALLLQGSRFSLVPWALTISERSLLVDLHAIVAWGAFAALSAQAVLSVAHLSPSVASIDPSGRRLSLALQAGFFLHTAMIATGSFYKFLLFGKAWSFDPVETLALLVWLSLGTILHLHLFAGWSGRRLAAWSLLGFALLALSYRVIVHFPPTSTYHLFDVDLRLHMR